MNLPPLVEAFVLHFGEMGGRWGINRTVGQIYAVLFLAQEPMNAEELCDALGFSRSNVSMGLKELQAWSLVEMRHRPGDRREYFETPRDVWAIVRTLVEQRKRREIDPTLTMLRELLMRTPQTDAERHAQARIAAMHEQIELLTGWYEEVRRLDTERLVQLLSLGSSVVKVLDFKDRLLSRRRAIEGVVAGPAGEADRTAAGRRA